MRQQEHISLVISLLGALIMPAAGCSSWISAQKFEPTWESLQQYECPAWFRDAKLGIFMHWGPCSVPAVDGWYGRNMYIEGHRAYQHHVKTYGHPSKFGYKDIIALWKAEKFNPDKLVRLYKQAGAKYVVPVAVHHDNFDLWNSKHHRWNVVNTGPRGDIIGMWRSAILKHGLRLGVSAHLARSYSWFNTNKGSDKKGPYANVPYDGNDPRYADLYHEKHDDTNRRYPKTPPEAWKQAWYSRVKDLVDNYRPDRLYFDGGIPFGQVGREMVAYYYNENMRWHKGKLEAVLNIKKWDDGSHGDYRDGICVRDVERGVLGEIMEEPWQTDTSIGPWYYRTNTTYKSVDSIVDSFVDIVSKNGNLLLNIPPRADGTLDEEAESILIELGKWMNVNGEAIYGTRPWKIFGEGPTPTAGGHFKERTKPFTSQDIRFTTKGNVLYAIALGWPDNQWTITKLSKASKHLGGKVIADVKLLGHNGTVNWRQTNECLVIQPPASKPCDHAFAFKIRLRQPPP